MSMRQTLEPVCRKDSTVPLNISLRGSLASEYYRLVTNHSKQEARTMIDGLLASSDCNIYRYLDRDILVIGLISERGHYWPDW